MLERDPTSDSYTIYARDSCLDPIRKDPACIQFMTVMMTCWEATAANLDEGASRKCQNILMLRWG